MAKQVWAGVMKKVVVRQKKWRNEWGEWERLLSVVKYKHMTRVRMDGIQPPFSKYRVTEILWKRNDCILKTCCQSVKYILIKMGKNETLLIWNSIELFTKRHDFKLV